MENNNTVQNVVHGFKVFRPDWTCSPNGTLNSTLAPENLRKKGNLMFAVMVCTSVRLLPTVSIITVSTVKTRLQKSLLMVM